MCADTHQLSGHGARPSGLVQDVTDIRYDHVIVD
jgi:hypothetical protein